MPSIEKTSIALSTDMLAMVRQAVASGDYASASEVIREALREWKARRGVATPVAPASGRGCVLTMEQRREIAALCRRYSVGSLALFGSATREDFDPQSSDVDFAVTFRNAPDATTAKDYFDLKQELERVFGRAVDLVEVDAMPESRLKRHIERTQVPLYAGREAA